MPRRRVVVAALPALLLGGLRPGPASAAPGVALAGRLGERALLMIDGQPHNVAVGQTVVGVRLLRWQDDRAVVDVGGHTAVLSVGGTPSRLVGGAAAPAGREIVLAAGPGGHFLANGSINGRSTQFMVDTGATLLALGRDEAVRLGIELANAGRSVTQTANGPVTVQTVTLRAVRVGDVEQANVAALVLPMSMPYVLLGNSFLSRFQMRRENDVMRLELR